MVDEVYPKLQKPGVDFLETLPRSWRKYPGMRWWSEDFSAEIFTWICFCLWCFFCGLVPGYTPQNKQLAPENGPLEDEIPIGNHSFSGVNSLLVSGRINHKKTPTYLEICVLFSLSMAQANPSSKKITASEWNCEKKVCSFGGFLEISHTNGEGILHCGVVLLHSNLGP